MTEQHTITRRRLHHPVSMSPYWEPHRDPTLVGICTCGWRAEAIHVRLLEVFEGQHLASVGVIVPVKPERAEKPQPMPEGTTNPLDVLLGTKGRNNP